VLDNDALDRRWPRPVKELDANRNVLRQAQSQATAPASGFTAGSSTPITGVGTFPASGVIGGSGRTNQPNETVHRWDALHNERIERDQGNRDLNRTRQGQWQTTPGVSSAGRQTPAPSSPTTHSQMQRSTPSMSPRMESPRSPSMHMESRPMGPSPSMGAPHSASPSFGGGAMSRGASAGGGGGGHSGGHSR
jgi:hypothetical protein